MYTCPICGNSDNKYIGYKNSKPYCRRCIMFELNNKTFLGYSPLPHRAYLKYPLTSSQQKCSDKIVNNFKKGINSFVYAVCGAGKTELVYQVIEEALKERKRVGFAIPRKDVVIELAKRLEESFKGAKIAVIYGGHKDILVGDIIVLTTHQLFRYKNYFDLLIMDEIDAFPYKGDIVLYSFFKRSLKGNYVLLSATPTDKLLKELKKDQTDIIYLFKRYHGYPLPVPKLIKGIGFIKYQILFGKLNSYISSNKPVLIFVPTIALAEDLFKFIKKLIRGGNIVHSKIKNRKEIIEDFRKGKYKYLVTTAVLERGVTLKDLQVIIFKADDEIYNTESLIQISGRVGRTIDCPLGDVIYVANKKTKYIEESINKIKWFNSYL